MQGFWVLTSCDRCRLSHQTMWYALHRTPTKSAWPPDASVSSCSSCFVSQVLSFNTNRHASSCGRLLSLYTPLKSTALKDSTRTSISENSPPQHTVRRLPAQKTSKNFRSAPSKTNIQMCISEPRPRRGRSHRKRDSHYDDEEEEYETRAPRRPPTALYQVTLGTLHYETFDTRPGACYRKDIPPYEYAYVEEESSRGRAW